VETFYLVEPMDTADTAILERWVRGHGGTVDDVVELPDPGAADVSAGPLRERLRVGGDPLLAPVRVAWLPKERNGTRAVHMRDMVLGDPRRPPSWRKQLILRGDPERMMVIAAEPARLSELRERFSTTASPADDDAAFVRFVARHALLALERAEYRAVGAQYKVPRLVREEIMSSRSFRARAARLAEELGRDPDEVWDEVETYLDEMVTGFNVLFLDLMARLGQKFKRPGYGDEIDYDRSQLERVRQEFAKHSVIVLPSHKSNLDGAIIPVVLHENGLPPAHTFAGINMAFWPVGPIMRHAGRIFIRRDTHDAPVYRWVLREYLSYLVEKRFPLEWYIEGTRSRTGKLGPPKLGLLRYVVDAYTEGRVDDVTLMPISIIYDQLHEVTEYAVEATGGQKQKESLAWMIRSMRAQRGKFGRIYVRFGEPLSLRAALGAVGEEDRSMQAQRLAFEIATRINGATAITASALVSLVLLSTRGRAMTASEIHASLQPLLEHIRARRLPLASSADALDTVDGVRSVASSLVATRTIDCYDQGDEPVYGVTASQHHAAAFYRNTIVHYFVEGAIAELALLYAAQHDGDRLATFWEEAFRLRDLLKFDFFFEQREAFRKGLTSEVSGRLPGWEDQLTEGVDPMSLLDRLEGPSAFGVLRPFVEAYLIAARALCQLPTDMPVEERSFIKRCVALGGQLVRQRRVRSPEAVSKPLFATALQLAAHRNLTEPGPDLAARRAAFADELMDVASRIDIGEQHLYAAWGRSMTAVPW
jgi:glycerol-3-phosphate O-acyltransferase